MKGKKITITHKPSNKKEFQNQDEFNTSKQSESNLSRSQNLTKEIDSFIKSNDQDPISLGSISDIETATNKKNDESYQKEQIDNQTQIIIESDPFIINNTMKLLIISLFVIALINVPIYYLLVVSGSTNSMTLDYKSFLYSTTIASISSPLVICASIPKSHFDNFDDYDLTLNCEHNKLSEIIYFGTSKSNKSEIDNLNNCNSGSDKIEIQSDEGCSITTWLQNKLTENCFDKNNCTVKLDSRELLNECIPHYTKARVFFLQYTCAVSKNVNLGENLSFSKSTFSNLFVGFDCISVLILMSVITYLLYKQDNLDSELKKKQKSVRDFSVEILNQNIEPKNIYFYLDRLISHINKLFSEINVEKEQIIYDINFSYLCDRKLELLVRNNQVIHDLTEYNRMIKYVDDPIEFLNIEAEITELTQENKLARKELKHLNDEFELQCIDSIFITFKNEKFKKIFTNFYDKSVITRFLFILFCKKNSLKKYYFNGKWLELGPCEDPTSIHWQHSSVPNSKRVLRQVISVAVAFIFLVLSVAIIMLIKNFKNNYYGDNPGPTNCTALGDVKQIDIHKESQRFDFGSNKVKTFCFCYNYYVINGLAQTKNYILPISEKKICKNWETEYFDIILFEWSTILIIPIVNTLISTFLRIVEGIEKNKTKTNDLISGIFKIFCLQFFNTSFVLFLVNTGVTNVYDNKYKNLFFGGNYSDVQAGWFLELGTILLSTIIFNAFSPHLPFIIVSSIRKVRAWFIAKLEMTEVPVDNSPKPEFPIENRFSEIMTTISLCYLFSTSIPVLYLFTFISLLVSYLLDWFMMKKYFTISFKNQSQMNRTVLNGIYYVLIIHLLISIWTFGNPIYLIGQQNPNIVDLTVIEDINNRMLSSHNLILLLFIALSIIVFVFQRIKNDLIAHFACLNIGKILPKEKSVEYARSVDFNTLYRIYEMRNLQFNKLKKIKKQSRVLNSFYEDNLAYDVECLKAKMKNIDPEFKFEEYNNNLEEQVKIFVEKNQNKEDECLIFGGKSYNISHFPEFEAHAYNEFALV